MMDIFMMIKDEYIPDFAGFNPLIQPDDTGNLLAFQDTGRQP